MLATIGDAAAGVLSSPIVTGLLMAMGVTLAVVWLAADLVRNRAALARPVRIKRAATG